MVAFGVTLILATHVASALYWDPTSSNFTSLKSQPHGTELLPGLTKRFSRPERETMVAFSRICHSGHFVNLEAMGCEPCLPDHYMPDALHSQLRCYPCQHAKPDSPEMDLAPCTPTADTVIGCQEGYFFHPEAAYQDNRVKCYPCTKCERTSHLRYETRPCGQSMDTLCCPRANMRAVWKEGQYGSECQSDTPKPLYEALRLMAWQDTDSDGHHEKSCGKGQFLKKENRAGEESCETCPDGTFMTKDNHTSLLCFSCGSQGGPRDSIMGCSSKKEPPVVVACINDKYICYPADKDPTLRQCCDCTPCQYVGRQCTNESDAECCPKPNMIFVDGQCQQKIQTSPQTSPQTRTSSSSSDKDSNGHDAVTVSSPTTLRPGGSNDNGINVATSVDKTQETSLQWILLGLCIVLTIIVIVLTIFHIPKVRNRFRNILISIRSPHNRRNDYRCCCRTGNESREETTEMNTNG